MKRMTPEGLMRTAGVLAVLGLTACPPPPDGTDAGPEPTSVTITQPTSNETVAIDGFHQVPMAVEVTEFTLAAPGTCSGASKCGHLYVKIDDDECLWREADGGENYSGRFWRTSFYANLRACLNGATGQATPVEYNGARTLSVELRNDDGTPYEVNGSPVTSSVPVTVTGHNFEGVIPGTTSGACTPQNCDPGLPASGVGFKFIDGHRVTHPEADNNGTLYTTRLRAPPFFAMPIHYHNSEERLVVLSGSLHTVKTDFQDWEDIAGPDGGVFETIHRTGFGILPAGRNNMFFAGAKGAYIQLHGTGVFYGNFFHPTHSVDGETAGFLRRALLADGGLAHWEVDPTNAFLEPILGYCQVEPNGSVTNVDGGCLD